MIIIKNYNKVIREFNENITSGKLIKNSFLEIMPNRYNKTGTIVSLILGIIFAVKIGFSFRTIDQFNNTLEILLNIQLVIFGFIFSIYSILLAFFSDEFVKKVTSIEDTESNKSFLYKCLTYYESVLYLYFINIAVTGIIMFSLICLPKDFQLFSNYHLNNFLSSFLMSIFYSFSFRVIFELKSTIFNTIRLFRSSISYRILDFMDKDE